MASILAPRLYARRNLPALAATVQCINQCVDQIVAPSSSIHLVVSGRCGHWACGAKSACFNPASPQAWRVTEHHGNLALQSGTGYARQKWRHFSNIGPRGAAQKDACTVYSEDLQGHQCGIRIITLSRPEVRNAINFAMIHQLLQEFQKIRFDQNVRVVILRAEQCGTFCAGADLKERLTLPVHEYWRWSLTIRQMTSELSQLPVPTVAAMDGHALGGGLELALACDLRIAAFNALVGLPETGLAIIPGAGGTQRLSRLVGPSRAKQLVFTGRKVSADEARKCGVVNLVVQQDAGGEAAFAHALKLATAILKRPNGEGASIKSAVSFATEMPMTSATVLEQLYVNTGSTKENSSQEMAPDE